MKGKEFASLHPLVLMVYFVLALVVTMFVAHPVLLAINFCGVSGYVIAFRGAEVYRKQIPLILLLVLISAAGNMILSHNGQIVLFRAGDNNITLEAILYGTSMGLVIATVLLWFVSMAEILTMDKVLSLFGGAFPALTLTICMMLRYIPMLKDRYRVIHQAQRAMGRGVGEHRRDPLRLRSLRQSAKEFSILVSWSLENAIDTADAMESRGYGSGRRTQFSVWHFTARDGIALAQILGLGALAAAAVFWFPAKAYYYPTIYLPPLTAGRGILYLGYALLTFYPAIIEWKEGRKWRS